MTTVREVMKTHVQALAPDDTLQDAIDRLDLYYAHCLPVVDKNRHVLGHVTEQACTSLYWETYHRDAEEVAGKTVADAMSTACEPVTDTRPLDMALAYHVVTEEPWCAVVDETGVLVGTLHRIDVIQALSEGLLVS